MVRRQAAEKAIAKAVAVNPVILQVDHDFFAVASCTPGKGYLVERDPATGDLFCPCPAAEFTGCCFHRAALGIHLGTIPQAWMPAMDTPVAVAVAS